VACERKKEAGGQGYTPRLHMFFPSLSTLLTTVPYRLIFVLLDYPPDKVGLETTADTSRNDPTSVMECEELVWNRR